MIKKNKKLKHSLGLSRRKKQAPSPTQQGILRQALALHKAGRLPQAETLYRQILLTEPDHPEALLYLGVLAHEAGKSETGVKLIHQALVCRPNYLEAYYNLGIVFLVQGKMEEAVNAFRQALTLKPDYVGARNNLGNALLILGDVEEAVANYRRVLTLKPDYVETHYNLGNALDDLGEADEAAACYRKALSLKPDYVEAHYNLGLLLQGQGKPDEAAACYYQALSLRPDYVEAYNNLGIALKDQGRVEEAITSFRKALILKPDYTEAQSNLLFCLTYLPCQDVSKYLDEARHYGRIAAAKVRSRFSDWLCSPVPERLCVGLVSDDFRNHPVGYFLENLLTNIDPNQIELKAYPVRPRSDELTTRIRSRFAAWKPLAGLADEAAARLIRNDGIHILLDLSGHTSHNRLPVFAWKPAPVQASWLGYFASTGLGEMDYIIADRVSVPQSLQEHFTEKVWYLPETRLCFTPPVVEKNLAITPLPAFHNGCITYGCFQNLAKLNDEVLTVWGRIFQLLPNARLRLQTPLFSSTVILEQLQQKLTRNGITPERVLFENQVPRADYLASHEHIDIILDTFPFPGGTTTCEALWMGVPTVTIAGNTMLSRQGASLLACAGLRDWIANNEADYVAKAVAHSADLEKLSRLRAGLRQQVLASPLFDGPGFSRNFEAALWGMWHNQTKI
jgi:protein O-GlcNAc transferase